MWKSGAADEFATRVIELPMLNDVHQSPDRGNIWFKITRAYARPQTTWRGAVRSSEELRNRN